MGYLQIADNMVDNSMKMMEDVLNSKFTTYISGAGTPVLVTYYSLDETMTSTDLGTGTIDSELGEHSPLRFNKIMNFPVYGLRELIPTKEELEGKLIDMNLDGEIIILPNTIKPTEYDYFTYKYDDNTIIIFHVVDFEFGTIKSNNYYKLTINLKDINSTQIEEKLDNQSVCVMESILDRFGTTERCIIKKTVFDYIKDIEKLITYLTDSYIDAFYNERYRTIYFRTSSDKAIIYDPYLAKFISDNAIFDYQKDRYILLTNHDYRSIVNKNYHKSIFRNIELCDKHKLYAQLRIPVTFETSSTNPFSYYGEDSAFTMDIENYPLYSTMPTYTHQLAYVPVKLLERIDENLLVNEYEYYENTEDTKVEVNKTHVDKPLEDGFVRGKNKSKYKVIPKVSLNELVPREDPKPIPHKHHKKHNTVEDRENHKVIKDIELSQILDMLNGELPSPEPEITGEHPEPHYGSVVIPSPGELPPNSSNDIIDDDDDLITSEDDDISDTNEYEDTSIPHERCVLHDNRPSKEYFNGIAHVDIDTDGVTSQYTHTGISIGTTSNTEVFGKDANKYSTIYWNLIITYINSNKLDELFKRSKVDIEDLLRLEVENDYETFIYMPMVLYILHKYIEYMRDVN